MHTQSRLEVQKCPMCGAPLRIHPHDTTALCVYCDAPITIHRGSQGEYQLSEDQALGREAATQIKKLLASGQEAQASLLYAQRTGVSAEEANQTIVNFSEHTQVSLFFRSTLNALGMSTALLLLGLVGLSGWLITVKPGIGIAVIVPALLFLLLLRGQFIRTIHYLTSARIGQARVLYHALLLDKIEDIRIARVNLEVHGPDGERFEVETHIKVRESALSKIQSGQVLEVKYLPNQPDSVLYGRGLKSTIIG